MNMDIILGGALVLGFVLGILLQGESAVDGWAKVFGGMAAMGCMLAFLVFAFPLISGVAL